MPTEQDYAYMARALRLAHNGICSSAPNPTVGCVIASSAGIVGEGWTAPVGGPHAERNALAAAADAAAGATAYVTLEPCSHFGRTAPCADALIDARLDRVVCASLDPNPLVSGQGVERLQAAGISVDVGLLEDEAREINAGFFSRMERGRPWIRSKLAASLDGRTALANGISQWITSPAARRDVHRWRARSSAVMTASGTVLADDPSLDARLDGDENVVQPCRVIIDSGLHTPFDAKTLGLPGDVHIFTTNEDIDKTRRLEAAGARVHLVAGNRYCDLDAVFEALAALEINDVFVEAGASLNGALLRSRLIDELIFYFAPVLLGDEARGMFALGSLVEIAAGVTIDISDIRPVGSDLRIIARLSNVAGTSQQ